MLIGPAGKYLADKFAPTIDLDVLGYEAQRLLQARHHGHHVFAFERLAHMNGQALTTTTYRLSLTCGFCAHRRGCRPQNLCTSTDADDPMGVALTGGQLPDCAWAAYYVSSSPPSSKRSVRAYDCRACPRGAAGCSGAGCHNGPAFALVRASVGRYHLYRVLGKRN